MYIIQINHKLQNETGDNSNATLPTSLIREEKIRFCIYFPLIRGNEGVEF